MSARLSDLPGEQGSVTASGGAETGPLRRAMDARGNAVGDARAFIALMPAGLRERRLAMAALIVSALAFAAAAPFAKLQLPAVPAFIPIYQSALVVGDLVTALLLFGQFRILRARALLFLASAYLFTACMAVAHTLSFPGLFAPGGLLGAGPQTTAWLYMFWHGGFPVLAIAYALDKHSSHRVALAPSRVIPLSIAIVLGVACALTLLTTAGQSLLPAIMQGSRYTATMMAVVSTVWGLSAVALVALWLRRPHSILDLWLMVVMCAWIFDIALSAVLNAGRFDLGFYVGRIYGLLAASFVLVVLLLENNALYLRLARAHARHRERLRILHEIDRAVVAEQPPEAISAAVIQPLRELLGVPRAIVNRFDLGAGMVEWIAAAGRRRVHVGPGVRYSIELMGDLAALRRGEPQIIDVHRIRAGAEAAALLESGVHCYLVVPMVAGEELIGAISFGGATREFPAEQVEIAREVATQLAIAVAQARLLEKVKSHASDLERRVEERTAALQAVNKELEAFSYSVSHDLRAPLRAVDGYARMLEEDYRERLDDEGRRLLQVVRDSANRMGRLIDDLLEFSRIGRQEPAARPVDMAALVAEVIGEVRGESRARIEVGELPPAHADRAMVKQVWVNLVGNALKYSGKRDAPQVQVQARTEGAETVYSVRDNGAGFDMRYAQKLFGVFQRLHRAEEFPGTGVGLAIVQRVVARHGGRVWAEGRPGEGACFFFSLPAAAA
jgi:signal transduction histidine kinase